MSEMSSLASFEKVRQPNIRCTWRSKTKAAGSSGTSAHDATYAGPAGNAPSESALAAAKGRAAGGDQEAAVATKAEEDKM